MRKLAIAVAAAAGLFICLLVGWIRDPASRVENSQQLPSASGAPAVPDESHVPIAQLGSDGDSRSGLQAPVAEGSTQNSVDPTAIVEDPVKAYRRKDLDGMIARFNAEPGKEVAQAAIVSAITTILDAAGRYEGLPLEGEIPGSESGATATPDTQSLLQMLGDLQVRKYTFTKQEFPLYWELQKCQPAFITGRPELSPEQIQAVKDQLEIARQLVQ